MRLKHLFTVCLLLLLGFPGVAMSLDFNAFWLYRTSGGDNRDSRTVFQERYSLGVGPQLDWRPTHAVTLSGGVGYNRTQSDSGAGMVRTEEITPAASLTLTNDIFSLGLAGELSQSSGSNRQTTTGNSWDASLASRWSIPYWPGLRLNYSQRDEGGDTELLERSERIQTSGSAAVDWDLRLVQLDYRYSTTLDEDRSSGDSTDSDSHFLRGESGGSLLNNRVSFRLSQQYQLTDSSSQLFGELLLASGTARFDNILPTDPAYRDPDDPEAPSLDPPEQIHIQFRITGFEQQVDVIRLDYNPFLGQERPPLVWDLYLRNFAGVWEAAGVIVGIDDAAAGFVVLPINREVEELLLVSQDSALRLPPATAFRLFNQDGEQNVQQTDSTSTNLLTNAGVNVSLTRTLRASLNASFEQLDGESVSTLRTTEEGDQITQAERESQRRTLSGRLVWTPAPWVTPSLGFSETTEDQEALQFGAFVSRNLSERVNRSYSMTIATRPSAALGVTFGVTKTETTAEENNRSASQRIIRDRVGDGMQYSVTTSAQLYPDLNTSLFVSYSEREEQALETRTAADGTIETSDQRLESTSFGIRSNFNARLRSDVTADLTTNFRIGSQQRRTLEQVDGEDRDDFPRLTKSSPTTADTSLVLSYRPSNYLSLRGFFTTYFLDSTQDDRMGAGLTLALLRTSKTRVTMDYNIVYVDEVINSFGLNGSWNISHALSLQGRTNYTMSDSDFYSAQLSLNLRL